MQIITNPAQMQKASRLWQKKGLSVGLVPTMGALHSGHEALIRKAGKMADRVVVSVYVNPSQFNSRQDLLKYPQRRAADARLAKAAGADILFRPKNLYEGDHSTWVEETECARGRCGAKRPGHFRGVATVVVKLFGIVQPTLSIFGEKDRQQCEVLARVVRDLCLPVKIVRHPILREKDGLAMSSRNLRLTPSQLLIAGLWAKAIKISASAGKGGAVSTLRKALRRISGVKLDYAEIVSGHLCAAAWVGPVRLIDNRPCGNRR